MEFDYICICINFILGQFYEIHKITIIIYYSHFTNVEANHVEADWLSITNTKC